MLPSPADSVEYWRTGEHIGRCERRRCQLAEDRPDRSEKWVDIQHVREIKSGFRRLSETAPRELAFCSAVVNTSARSETELGSGHREARPRQRNVDVVELTAHFARQRCLKPAQGTLPVNEIIGQPALTTIRRRPFVPPLPRGIDFSSASLFGVFCGFQPPEPKHTRSRMITERDIAVLGVDQDWRWGG